MLETPSQEQRFPSGVNLVLMPKSEESERCPGSGGHRGTTSDVSKGMEHPSIPCDDSISPDAIP